MIAILSIVHTTYLFFKPSKPQFKASYVLVALTVISGTYLILVRSTNMLHSCSMGLLYLGATLAALAAAHNKLAPDITK